VCVCIICVRVCIKINKMEKKITEKKESAIPTPGIDDQIPRVSSSLSLQWRLQRSYTKVTRIFFLFLLLLFYSFLILSSAVCMFPSRGRTDRNKFNYAKLGEKKYNTTVFNSSCLFEIELLCNMLWFFIFLHSS
jgi:hypothetical protein